MSKKDDTVTTQSDEAGSTVLSGTILESQLEEIKRDLRGKVSGKFLRLTAAHNDRPVFIRAENIGAYHDQYDDIRGFQGCWLTGTSFGFSVKEYAEDIQALIAQVEGEYSASELAETLIALLVVAGTDPAEARALLSTAPREALVKRINELGERLAVGARDQADREMFGQRHEALMQAGDKILQALGITSEQFDQEAGHGLDDHGAMLRMLGRAVELIGGLKERADNAEIDANDLRKKLLQHRSDQEKLTSACGKVLQALGIATEPDPALGHDKHSHLLLALTVAAERIEALQADGAKDASLASCIEQQQVEIERQQEEIEKQRREIAAFRDDAAAYLKNSDELSRQVSEQERQIEVLKQRLSVYEGQS